MNISSGAETAFKFAQVILLIYMLTKLLYYSWFVNLATTAGFSSWFSMNLTYIFFCGYSSTC